MKVNFNTTIKDITIGLLIGRRYKLDYIKENLKLEGDLTEKVRKEIFKIVAREIEK